MFTSRRRLATLAAAVSLAAGSRAAATAPPVEAPVDTSFLRAQAEAQFLAENPDATQVACAVPTADEPGVQFLCYGARPDGTVLTLQASMNDDGGLVFAPVATAPETTTAPTTVAPAVYEGDGSAVVQVTPVAGLAIATVTHDGAGEVVVQPQNAGAAVGAPLAAASPSSRFLVGLDGPISAFAVTAAGPWAIAVEPATGAAPADLTSPVSGTTPDVLRYSDAGSDATVTFDGTGPIVVRTVTAAGATTLVDSPGPSSQVVTLPPGPGFLVVVAVGPWSVSVGDPSGPVATAVG